MLSMQHVSTISIECMWKVHVWGMPIIAIHLVWYTLVHMEMVVKQCRFKCDFPHIQGIAFGHENQKNYHYPHPNTHGLIIAEVH